MLNSIEIGTRIKERQKILGLKQKDIIEKTGISKAAISNYVNGGRIPEAEALYKISKILNTSGCAFSISSNNMTEYGF